MPIRLLITRPALSAAETAAELQAQGYGTLVAPVLVAAPLPSYDLQLAPGDRAIVTSPQAAQVLGGWKQFHTLPTLAVGARTAHLLQQQGFQDTVSVDGDARAIVEHISQQQDLGRLHLLCAPTTGQWLEQALQQIGHEVNRVAVYTIAPVERLTDEAVAALDQGLITHALFYSAFTAQTFLRLAGEAKIIGNLAQVTTCCLSEAVARVVTQAEWRDIKVAAAPNSRALQDLLPPM